MTKPYSIPLFIQDQGHQDTNVCMYAKKKNQSQINKMDSSIIAQCICPPSLPQILTVLSPLHDASIEPVELHETCHTLSVCSFRVLTGLIKDILQNFVIFSFSLIRKREAWLWYNSSESATNRCNPNNTHQKRHDRYLLAIKEQFDNGGGGGGDNG